MKEFAHMFIIIPVVVVCLTVWVRCIVKFIRYNFSGGVDIKKVYCKNCKWCKYEEFASLGVNWGWFCWLEYKITINGIGQTIYDFSKADCNKKNKNKDCKDYKRKWYKFWA